MAGIASLVIGTIVMILIALCLWKKNKRKGTTRECHLDHMEENELEVPLFDFNVAAVSTENFSPVNKPGEGGFGAVYKGNLKDGEEIAAKRLSRYSVQGVGEFRNEVRLIVKLQHRNLVRLLGCCHEGEEKMLVYEYMPNKSLDAFIFEEEVEHNFLRVITLVNPSLSIASSSLGSPSLSPGILHFMTLRNFFQRFH